MKKKLFKGFLIAAYTICICLISVASTLLIQNHINNDSNEVQPNKYEYYARDYFDIFVAFGGYGAQGSTRMVPIETLLQSNLIKEEDKKVLTAYQLEMKDENQYYNIYLGVRDGEDIIELHHMFKPWKIFVFASNFPYKLESIIKEFEEMSGETLTKEFLNGSVIDSNLNIETSGILVNFKKITDNTYGIYYKTTLNGKVYIIDK